LPNEILAWPGARGEGCGRFSITPRTRLVEESFRMETIKWLTPLFALVGALWAVGMFLMKREADPGAELEIQLDFAGRQGGSWLIEVAAILRNQGFVRHWYHDFRVVVRYLLPDDPIIDGEAKIHYQLNCRRTIDERISGARRLFANASYIDPRLTFRHSYVTFVPADATFVWVQCSLAFPGRLSWYNWKKVPETKNVQRLFRVPD
jgi:hypothetical protein